jgi:hypothetical protein
MPRMRVISIEDHFWTADIAQAIGALRNPDAASGTPLEADLADLGERRLAATTRPTPTAGACSTPRR